MANFPTQAIPVLNITDDVSVISAVHIEDLYNDLNAHEAHTIKCFSKFIAYIGAADQALTQWGNDTIRFKSEVFDEMEEFDADTDYIFNAVNTGYYLAGAHVEVAPGTIDRDFKLSLMKNAVTEAQDFLNIDNAEAINLKVVTPVYLVPTDDLYCKIYHDSPTGQHIEKEREKSYFWAMRIN